MKRKLFLLLCALLTSVGMWAQDWTGSEVGEGYALLYNVGTGKYFTRGNVWNTQASIGDECAAMTVKLELSSGKYKIRTLTSNGLECLNDGTVYTDQSNDKNSTWTFTEIDAENHVYNIISADNHGGGSDKYLTAEGGSSTIVGPGNDGTSDNAKWKVYLYSDQQAKLADAMSSATSSNPVNVTAFIKDASFGAYQDVALECWTVTASNKNMNGGNLANPCAETFQNGGGKIYQTISELPNGKYEVKCQGFYRQDSGSTPSYLYANSNQVALKILNGEGEGTAESMDGASNSFTAGYYEVSLQVIVTDGSLTVGIQGQPGNWTCFDNFRLNYLGEASVSELQSLFGDLQTQASTTLTNNTYDNVTGSERTDLQTLSVAAAAGTVDGLNEQINNIKAAINDFISSKSSYDSFDVEKASAMDMGVAEGDIVRPTSASNLQDALHALYVQEDVASKAGYTVDATGIFGTWTPQNIDIIAGEHWDGTATTQYYDRYQDSGYTSSITNTMTLPAGKYVFKAAARASTGVNGAFNMSVKIGNSDATYKHYQANGNSGKGIDKSGAANYGAGEFANNNNGRGWEWRFISFELDDETSVRVQIYAQMLANNWVGFSDITLLTTEDNIEICRRIYEANKTTAETARDNAEYTNVVGIERTALVNAINADVTETYEGYNIAASNLETATNTFTAAKPNYDAYLLVKGYGEAIDAELLPYATSTKLSAVTTALATPVTSASTAEAATAEINTANRAAYESNAIAENVPGVSRTNLIKNAYGSATDGWSGEFWTMTNEPYTQANGTTATSYFDKNGVKTFTTSQTIKLPKGKYILSVTARALSGIDSYKMQVTNNEDETEEVELSAIGNQNGVFGRGWNDFFVVFEQKDFGDATITITGDNTTSDDNFWMSWGRFRLYSISGEGAYEISEDEAYTPVNGDVAGIKVSLARTIKSDVVNTLVLPFDMSQSEVETAFGTGSKVYVVDSYDAENEKVVFSQDENGITANKPCLLKATSAGTAYNFTGRTLKAGTATDTGENISMTGNYAKPFTVPENNYIISGGSIYLVNSEVAMKTMRAYITLTNSSSARVSIAFDDDDPTAINAIEAAEEAEGLEDGKYLIDGQIVIVKNGVKYSANGQILK